MSDDRLPHVFSPLSIGPMTVQNRIFSSAHQTTLTRDHLPTPEFLAYHRERARGGTGAIVMEATAVHPSGLLTPKTIAGYLPASVDAMAEVADAVHENGTGLLTQLFHGGREQIASAPRRPAVGPSAVPTTRFHVEPRSLEMTEIIEIIEGYAIAAAHMQQAGLDGIEISSSHAYLPSQFFSRRSNVRTDRFGPEHPLQFLTEVVDTVRSRVGTTLAIGVRLALDEMSESGLDETACAEVAAQVSERLPVDFISFTMGDSATFSGGSFIAPRPRSMPESILARLPERATGGGPVVMATTRVVDIEDAEHAIARGLTDMVGMTRAQIADPHLVRKAREGEPIIPCTGCNIGCIGHYHAGLPIACTMNQATGRETELPQPVVRREADAASANQKRIAILGGGVAGMAAAAELASANATVTVFESDADIGGQLRIAGSAPDHEYTWSTWRDWQETLIRNLAIDVRLGSPATDEELTGFDDVIDARGAEPFLEGKFLRRLNVNVIDAWSFLREPLRYRGEHVLVSDWGGEPTGLDCVEVALEHCRKVHYAYAGAEPAVNIHQYQRFGYLTRIDVAECEVVPFAQADVVDDRVVLRGSFSDRVRALPEGVTTVVIAHGRTPRYDPECAKRTRVGDLDGPRGLEEAALEGYEAARAILETAE